MRSARTPELDAPDRGAGRHRPHLGVRFSWFTRSPCGAFILFSHPRDFTPVCTTELGYVARLKPEFDKRHVKAVRGLSIDPVESHKGWAKDIQETQGHAPNFPIVADLERKEADLYGMMRPAHDEVFTVRTVLVVDPKKKIRLMITYPEATGRNFDEILRVIDSLQLTDAHRDATPVNWKQGAGRGRRHRARGHRRGGKGEVPGRLEGPEALPPPHTPAQVGSSPIQATHGGRLSAV